MRIFQTTQPDADLLFPQYLLFPSLTAMSDIDYYSFLSILLQTVNRSMKNTYYITHVLFPLLFKLSIV